MFGTIFRKQTVLGLALLMLFLAACSSPAAEVVETAVSPTEVPPTEIPPTTTPSPDELLTGAILADDVAEVQRLLEAGADPNLERNLVSPMFAAVNKGNIEVVKLLIAHGGDVMVETRSGTTLLDVAHSAGESHIEIVAFLREQTPPPTLVEIFATAVPATSTSTNTENMVLVPAGPFEMGRDPYELLLDCQEFVDPFWNNRCQVEFFESSPLRIMHLEDYYIDLYEVTNAEYAACVAEGVCALPAETSSATRDSYYGDSEFDNYPVIHVTWEDADTYCTWRGARLPTAAEWEKAARGPESLNYPWGDTFDGDVLNFCDVNCPEDAFFHSPDPNFDDGYADTAPVGSYPEGVSPYGLFDMGGNVIEWMADTLKDMFVQVSLDSPIRRGGSWAQSGGAATSPAHDVINGDRPSDNFTGFRCASTP
jgi:formylglycine-generating enzyme required for sulfatase activity